MRILGCRGRGLLLVAVIATLTLLPACGGGGSSGGGKNDNDLVVVKFALIDQVGQPTGATGTENAYRNNRLTLTFSEKLDPSTVSDRTIQIGIPSGTNLFLTAQGRFLVDGNVVTFDPTVTVMGAPHPFGFEPNSVYSVIVKGLPDAKTLLTVQGKPVLSPFATTFTTTDQYLPDLDQPRVVGISPPSLDPVPADRYGPEAQAVWVNSRADVVVEFSEAMNPATFDSTTSFRVNNLDRGGREVFGTFRFSDDAKTVTFRPTFGFGRGPYVIQVALSVGITDLAGNPIGNPQQWVFLTEFDPSAVNEGLIEEYFDDNAYEDTAFTPPGAEGIAQWNPFSDPGVLASTFGTRILTVPCPAGGSSNYIPLGGSSWVSCRFQSWYKASELGQAGTIVGLAFPVGSVITQGAVMTNFIVQCGHSNKTLTPGPFAANFNVGVGPITVINGATWTMPTDMVYNQWTWYLATKGGEANYASLEKGFPFDGTNNLVVDVGKSSVTGSGNTWSCRSGWDSNTRRIWNTSQSSSSSSGSDTGYTYPYLVSFRTERSMAQSLWYRTESADPVYLEAIISPTEQPPGTETIVVFQGAMDDGSGHAADLGTVTGWTSDILDLDGHQYVRFRATFTANLGTGVGPKLNDIVIPYIFF